MGDALVSALVKEMVQRLTSAAIQEFGLLRRFKGDILALKKDFELIQAVLEDAEEKQIKEKAVELWLHRLRSASLMAENVLDEVSTEALLQRLNKQLAIERGIKRCIKYKVSALFSKVMFRARAAHKVKAIRTNLDEIASKRLLTKLNLAISEISHVDVGVKGEKSHVDVGVKGEISHVDVGVKGEISHVDVGVNGEMPDRETSSRIHDSTKIVGRDEEVEMITRTICNKDIGKYDNGKIRVYGIWGMGGLGKTTLAQLVYNHKTVDQYFDLKCWVYVSENFQVIEILKAIITSIDKCECTLTRLDVLQESLESKLREKKFLIVLDDVWAEENEKKKWEGLSGTLSCGAEGSIVVMTTRSERTIQMMVKAGELRHELGCLSEENSWLLFKKYAFAQGRVGDDIGELEPIGREMVVKCKGLPLAVKTLGSLMWSKSSRNDWQRVKDNNIWNIQEKDVLPALKLSYDNLAPHVKRCFSYFCLFPKGYKLKKDEMIMLWVANGFIPPRGEANLFVIGREIFDCLVWKSLFQLVDGNEYVDGVDRCKMHDLVHDMALHVMRHDCLIVESPCNKDEIPNEVLHLSLSDPDEKFTFSSKDLGKLASLRSIFMFGEGDESCVSQLFNHVYLRVLHLSLISLRTLPGSICKLKHLRYMNLSNSGIEVLPESIMYLQNLQVLILRSTNIEVLPEGLKYLINLQVLDNYDCSSLLHFPSGIEKLTSLRMLPRFPVGKKRGAKISELGDLNLLDGKLEIEGLKNVGGLSEAKSANLKCKTNLSRLMLSWAEGIQHRDLEESTPEMFPYIEEVLEGLEPNPSLEILDLSYYMGKTISPSWMENLRNLVSIVFYKCRKCEHIPPLGRFPNLRCIKLFSMDSLKRFHDDDINMSEDNTDMFLCLQTLRIQRCPKLVSLPSNLPKLEVLELDDCNRLISLPSNLPKLVKLELFNCKGLISLPSNLPNIVELELLFCDGLLSLPDEIQSFKGLNKLEIYKCEHLSKRCISEKGEDWHKISHIPEISII